MTTAGQSDIESPERPTFPNEDAASNGAAAPNGDAANAGAAAPNEADAISAAAGDTAPGAAPTAEAAPGLAALIGFGGPDAPAAADMYRCVHCGLCLSACPTYLETALETESPRGRIALMKAVHEERVEITPRIVAHWEACLQCRACEAVCPSGVPYGRMMEHTRAQVRAQGRQSPELRRLSRLFLRAALPYPRRLRLGALLLRLYQRWGLRRLARASGLLRRLPGDAAQLEASLPEMSRRFFRTSSRPWLAQGERRRRVALLAGCVMPLMQAPTMRDAVYVLTRNGCEVAAPLGQGCCGALNFHAGDLDGGRAMARRNIDALLSVNPDAVITCSAGCGSSMKEYAELLSGDPEYADKARRFSELTQDITEFLAGLPLLPPEQPLYRRVTYQEPCHLAHAQRIQQAPRAVLRAIPGVELAEMEQAALCCGGAGLYAALQPGLSQRLQTRKLNYALAANAQEIITANPGCMLQLEQGLRRRSNATPVRHIVELLAEAYRRPAPERPAAGPRRRRERRRG